MTRPPPSSGNEPSLDEVLKAFANRDRRRLLVDLQDGGSQTLTEFVRTWADDRDHDQLRLRMRHHHLPRLERSDLVDVANETIHRGEAFDDISAFLDFLRVNVDDLPEQMV